MKITDLNGYQIEITDPDTAIEQAESFKDYHHIPPVESDGKKQAYWRDMYYKLLELKQQHHE